MTQDEKVAHAKYLERALADWGDKPKTEAYYALLNAFLKAQDDATP